MDEGQAFSQAKLIPRQATRSSEDVALFCGQRSLLCQFKCPYEL